MAMNFLNGSIFSSTLYKFSAQYPINIQNCAFKFCESSISAGAISIKVFTSVFISNCDYIECKGNTAGAIHVENVREANIQSERFSQCIGSSCSSIYLHNCINENISIDRGEDTNENKFAIQSYYSKANITNFNISSKNGKIFGFFKSTAEFRHCLISKMNYSVFTNSTVYFYDTSIDVYKINTIILSGTRNIFIGFTNCNFSYKLNISNTNYTSFINCSFNTTISFRPTSYSFDGIPKVIKDQIISTKIDFYQYNIINIKRTHFVDLSSNEFGGAIHLYRSCHATIYQTVFLRCSAQNGGCIYITRAKNITTNSVCYLECFATNNAAFILKNFVSGYTMKNTFISITGLQGYEYSSFSIFRAGSVEFSRLNCTRCHCNNLSVLFYPEHKGTFEESQFFNITGNILFRGVKCTINKSNLNEISFVGIKSSFAKCYNCTIINCTLSNIHGKNISDFYDTFTITPILYNKFFECYEFPADNELSKSPILIISLSVACGALGIALLIFFIYTWKVKSFANQQRRRSDLENELFNDFG